LFLSFIGSGSLYSVLFSWAVYFTAILIVDRVPEAEDSG